VSRPRRPIVIAGVLAAALAVPAVAGAEPNVPDGNLAASVLPIGAGTAVYAIDLRQAVIPLEEERTSGGQVTVSISADVLFDFGKATLTTDARHRIADLAPRLRNVDGTVQVSGHSDSIGSPAYNLGLSQRRADAVKAELRSALGGAGVQVEAKGYGETRPIASNTLGGKDNPTGRAKNRRVDITFDKS
jgi:outer membrane protein OmpA-like peptidoglycan-associated protein